MKKLLLFTLLIAIAYFSMMSGLLVTDPSTWVGVPKYEQRPTFSFLLDRTSDFYQAYTFHSNTEFVLRKLAHIAFYAWLAVLFYLNLARVPILPRAVLAWCLTSLVALLDEVNQYWVLGRDGRIQDVILDSAAALAALLFAVAVSLMRKRAKQRDGSPKQRDGSPASKTKKHLSN